MPNIENLSRKLAELRYLQEQIHYTDMHPDKKEHYIDLLLDSINKIEKIKKELVEDDKLDSSDKN